MIFLEGRARRAQVFELRHDIMCSDGECGCTEKVVHNLALNKETGVKRMVEKKVLAARTLTVLFKRRSRVEEAALSLPAVRAAINARRLRVVRQR
jgi:hypothetical protein